MFSVKNDWNPKNARLRQIAANPENFNEAIELALALHSMVHLSCVSGAAAPTYADQVFQGIEKPAYSIMPTKKDVTIAWNVWHISRIEDLTANILIAGREQVFDDEWKIKLNATATDTGNAMTDEEIIALSLQLDIDQLFAYRNAVGEKTRSILSGLHANDMKRKVTPEQTRRILEQGGVTEQEDSIWLLDFWGPRKKALQPLVRGFLFPSSILFYSQRDS